MGECSVHSPSPKPATRFVGLDGWKNPKGKTMEEEIKARLEKIILELNKPTPKAAFIKFQKSSTLEITVFGNGEIIYSWFPVSGKRKFLCSKDTKLFYKIMTKFEKLDYKKKEKMIWKTI